MTTVSLSCWAGLNESDTPTELVFILNGAEVILEVSPLRWVLFMGFVPHESRPVDPNHPGTTDRVYHSSFTKPLVNWQQSLTLSLALALAPNALTLTLTPNPNP